jgi:hypothetical protein
MITWGQLMVTHQIFVLSSVVKPLIKESDKPRCEDGESTEAQRLDIGIVRHLEKAGTILKQTSALIYCARLQRIPALET